MDYGILLSNGWTITICLSVEDGLELFDISLENKDFLDYSNVYISDFTNLSNLFYSESLSANELEHYINGYFVWYKADDRQESFDGDYYYGLEQKMSKKSRRKDATVYAGGVLDLQKRTP